MKPDVACLRSLRREGARPHPGAVRRPAGLTAG
jgi:hypothetical protein